MTEYSSNADKLIHQDIASLKDAQDLFVALSGALKGNRTEKAKMVLSQCRSLRVMLDGGMSHVNIKTSFPEWANYESKGHFSTALAYSVATGEHSAEIDERVANLATYASYKGVEIDVRATLTGWLDDGGRTHADAVDSLYGAFGSLEYLYNIARGAKLHADDPRNNVEEVPEVPEESGDDDGDDKSPRQSGEELIARGIRVMKEAGHSVDEIAAFFMATIGK